MPGSYDFLQSILNTVTEHIVVIDKTGRIQFVNRSWREFGENNSCLIHADWKSVDYLKVCDAAAAMGDEYGLNAADGIRQVIHAETNQFYFEYPCHSPNEKRWFMMRVTPFAFEKKSYFVISHQNITERKLAEEKVLTLARIDGLTNIANRRTFDEFLSSEWQRCRRLKMPVTLAIIDLDHFKLLNDTYGHQAGDDCLKKIAALLQDYARRTVDLCARYGGEEFSMVFGGTSIIESLKIVDSLLGAIRGLKIPNTKSPTLPVLTASIGMKSMCPDHKNDEKGLIKVADELLYSAKERGRNQVIYQN